MTAGDRVALDYAQRLGQFTARDFMQATEYARTTANERLTRLERAGYLRVVRIARVGGRGRPRNVYEVA